MSKRSPNSYDEICRALRRAPDHQYPSQLALALEKDEEIADLQETEVRFICEQDLKMSGKKDFRRKAKWILELTGDLHIVRTIGQSKNIQS